MEDKQIIDCPQCGGKLRVPITERLLKVKCSHCGHAFEHGISEGEIISEGVTPPSPDHATAATGPAGGASMPTRKGFYLPLWAIQLMFLFFGIPLALVAGFLVALVVGEFAGVGGAIAGAIATIFAGMQVYRAYSRLQDRRKALGLPSESNGWFLLLAPISALGLPAGVLMALVKPGIDAGDVNVWFAHAVLAVATISIGAVILYWLFRAVYNAGYSALFVYIPLILAGQLGKEFVTKKVAPNTGSDDLAFVGLVLAAAGTLASLVFFLWRLLRVRGPWKLRDPDGPEDEVAEFLTGAFAFAIVFILCLIIFSSEKMIGWPGAAAFAVSLFIPSLLLTLIRVLADSADGGFGWGLGRALLLAGVSLTAAVIAVQFPPSGTALVLLVLASVGTAVLLRIYRALSGMLSIRHPFSQPVLLNSLTIFSMALLLLTMPGSPSPAQRLVNAWAPVVTPLGEGARGLYVSAYGNPQARAVINVVEGMRYAAVVAYPMSSQMLDNNRARIVFDVLNVGEKGADKIRISLHDSGNAACLPADLDVGISPPLWPGERHTVQAIWSRPKDCDAKAWRSVLQQIHPDNKKSPLKVASKVISTAEFDRKALFKREARAWLGL